MVWFEKHVLYLKTSNRMMSASLQLTSSIAVSLGICCCVRPVMLLIKMMNLIVITKAASATGSVAKWRWRISILSTPD
jgi:hypothetical protein